MSTPTGSGEDLADPGTYRHWTDVTLRYSDQDPMGHVNNAAYLVYLEASRVMFLRQFLDLGGESVDTVLARITVDFLRETSFPGTLRIGARLLSLGRKSVTTGYGVFRDAQCLATSEAVNVFFDVATRSSTLPAPAVRAALEAALPRPD